jgi:3-oxoacyl-[acyl-carrier protein] reductase
MKALVVGGSKGLGAEIALRLLTNGHEVFVISRSAGTLVERWTGENDNLRMIYADLSNFDNFTKLIASNPIPFEQFDVVVNCLGGNLGERNFLADYTSYEAVHWHNFGYVVEINRRCLENMLKRKFGKICNISSVSAIENHGSPQYGTAKSALNAYTKALGRICAEKGVTIFGVMPGALLDDSGYWSRIKEMDHEHFERFRKTRLPSQKFDSSTSVANLIVFILEQEDSDIYAGSMILVDGGISKTYPQ